MKIFGKKVCFGWVFLAGILCVSAYFSYWLSAGGVGREDLPKGVFKAESTDPVFLESFVAVCWDGNWMAEVPVLQELKTGRSLHGQPPGVA